MALRIPPDFDLYQPTESPRFCTYIWPQGPPNLPGFCTYIGFKSQKFPQTRGNTYWLVFRGPRTGPPKTNQNVSSWAHKIYPDFFCQLQANFTRIPPYTWVQGPNFPGFDIYIRKNARKMPKNYFFRLGPLTSVSNKLGLKLGPYSTT